MRKNLKIGKTKSKFRLSDRQFNELCSKIKWDGQGLVPCIIQDENDRVVLMVAYMNRESLKRTLREGHCCFWSRSRQKFWLKGEQSGNFQNVKEVYIDCDGDCLLIRAKQVGNAACHTGMRSCFYRQLAHRGKLKVIGKRIFDPKKVYK